MKKFCMSNVKMKVAVARKFIKNLSKRQNKQAGAELCQAQGKLRLFMLRLEPS